MNYKKWTFSIVALLLLVPILFLVIFIFILQDYYPNNDLERKEYLLAKNPKIIFAGDSRSERALIPKLASDLLDMNDSDIVNIAMSSGDTVILNNSIDRYPEKFKNTTLVISISAMSLNDNAVLPGYFSNAMISQMSLVDKIKTFLPTNIATLDRYYQTNLFYAKLKVSHGEHIFANEFVQSNGFNGVTGELNSSKLVPNDFKECPFYVNYSRGKIKYQLINKSLASIKKKVRRVVVYTAPFAPSYIKMIEHDKLLQDELDFKKAIQTICEENGIEYKNYLVVDAMKDKYFYDFAHPNIEGATIFTKIVLSDFNLTK
jgi:hypothetical protein